MRNYARPGNFSLSPILTIRTIQEQCQTTRLMWQRASDQRGRPAQRSTASRTSSNSVGGGQWLNDTTSVPRATRPISSAGADVPLYPQPGQPVAGLGDLELLSDGVRPAGTP